jgi:hypothetical protein
MSQFLPTRPKSILPAAFYVSSSVETFGEEEEVDDDDVV